MTNPTSYICERSAEYVLVPQLMQILKKHFKSVVAIYPWMSREGGSISHKLHAAEQYRVIGLYARRPKLFSESDKNIKIKFNEQIIKASKIASFHGIANFAACPLARDFHELSSCTESVWSELSKLSLDDANITVELDEDNSVPKSLENYFLKSINSIPEIIMGTTRTITFNHLIKSIKEIEMASRGKGHYNRLAFMGGYKPIYFLISEN